MSLSLLTAPAAWPITLAEARMYCRVEDESFDAELSGYIGAACEHLENFTGTSLASRHWCLTLDRFADAIELPKGPVTAVLSVSYVDEDRFLVSLDPAVWVADLISSPQFVLRTCERAWPQTGCGVGVVEVRFVAGYGPVLCPAPLKMAMGKLVAGWFDGCAGGEDAAKLAEALARPYRRVMI